jgi:polar amino acid transport system substrate-binding protein
VRSRSPAQVRKFSIVAILSVAFRNGPALAQTPPAELRVGVYPVAPFVIEQRGELFGFSIELWNAIASRLNVKTSYQVVANTTALIADMRAKHLDLVASPVYITSARDAEFDFSQTIMDVGLGILVRESGEPAKPPSPFLDLLRLLLSPAIFVWLGISLALILIPAHIVWLLDRRSVDGVTEGQGQNYFPGIFHALFWAATALVSQAQGMPRQWFARLVALVWMFAGVVFVAFYTAQLTSTLTIQKIRGSIEGPSDLPGKQIATITNSTAEEYLRNHNALVQTFYEPDQMFQALLQKRVDAVVTVAPILLYYAAHDGKGLVRVVGPQFNTASIAIVFQMDSPLRKRVNSALIVLRENGTYQRLYRKWFGAD